MNSVLDNPVHNDSVLEADQLAPVQDDSAAASVAPPVGPPASVVEMLLKDQPALDGLLRDPLWQRRLIPRLLAVALVGFAVYGLVTTLVVNAICFEHGYWPAALPRSLWNRPSAGNLTLAYCLGLIAANGVCLPSFYFYGLLSGVKTTMLGVTAHALKGMAAGAVMLVGILPVYVALALSAIVFPMPQALVTLWVVVGLSLPFVAGLWGAVCLYRGFVCLEDTIPALRRESRGCLLRRLILAWSGCYTCVTPLMIYTLWNSLARVLP
jgi:hypothetical protein